MCRRPCTLWVHFAWSGITPSKPPNVDKLSELLQDETFKKLQADMKAAMARLNLKPEVRPFLVLKTGTRGRGEKGDKEEKGGRGDFTRCWMER